MTKSLMMLLMLCALALALLSGCAGADATAGLPTALPTEFLPTSAALTLQAALPNPTATFTPAPTHTPGITVTPTPEASSTPTEIPATPTPLLVNLPPTDLPTLAPQIPEGHIQIYRLGEMSKVISPIQVTGYLDHGAVGPTHIDLLGEDGRLLFREVRDFQPRNDLWANLPMKIEFEIAAAAELGHLVISTFDAFNRLQAVNSVNLVLLSNGEAEWNPTTTLHEPVVILQPESKALISGGVLIVSGVARTTPGQPLRVELVTEAGKIVGHRLAAVETPADGGWGPFTAEVAYKVEALTPVRVLVYETGDPGGVILRLASREVQLSP